MITFPNYIFGLKSYEERKNNVPPPPGRYLVTVTDAGTNEANGKQYIWVKFRVAEGEFAGRTISTRFYWQDSEGIGLGRFFGLVEACRLTPSPTFDEKTLLNTKLWVRTREKVNKNTGEVFVEYHYPEKFVAGEVPDTKMDSVPF